MRWAPYLVMAGSVRGKGGWYNIVQFGYDLINLSTRQFLADFYGFFEAHGFLVGKFYPEGVAFKPYDLMDEDFVGPNFVACHASRIDIIAAIRCLPLKTTAD